MGWEEQGLRSLGIVNENIKVGIDGYVGVTCMQWTNARSSRLMMDAGCWTINASWSIDRHTYRHFELKCKQR